MTSDVFSPGDVLGGKYRVVRALGEGGMAVVLEAVHLKLGHRVALKVLRAELATDASVVARFEREGRAVSRLKSPNVVRVFDVDTTPSGAPFLVMEYLEGDDLANELHRRGPLPIGEAVGLALQACSAMQDAHELGIIHRDLKPTNLFLAIEGKTRVLKVLDFGIASDAPAAHATDAVRLTVSEAVLGTPLYMAPEQFRSTRDVDARADVWALGATLYELLTGTPPFTGSPTTVGIAIVNDDVRAIETLRAEVPPVLRDVLFRALKKDREKRFPSMRAFAEALAPFSQGVVIAARSSVHSYPEGELVGSAETLLSAPKPPAEAGARASIPATGTAVTQDSAGAREGPSQSAGRSWATVAIAACVALAGAGGLFALRHGGAPVAPPAIPVAIPVAAPPIPTTDPPPSSPPDAAADASPLPARRSSVRAPPPHAAPSASPHPPPDSSSHPLFFPR